MNSRHLASRPLLLTECNGDMTCEQIAAIPMNDLGPRGQLRRVTAHSSVT